MDFDKRVLDMLKKFMHDVFIIQLDPVVKCTCVNFTTKQPDPSCKRCLGTGKKINIKTISAASQDTNVPPMIRPSTEVVIARNYYFSLQDIRLKDNDLIVDDEEIFFCYQSQILRSFKGSEVYQKCLTIEKKLDSKILLKNFNEIVGR
jgi:hypothetical protein